jgi:hypothetical protein
VGLLGGTTVIGKKLPLAAGLLAGTLLLGGCEMFDRSEWVPQESDAISIHTDGSITEIVQEQLDADYYNADELQQMITTEVQEYNSKNGADSITVTEFTVEDGTVNLKMEYASANDYAQFNQTELYYGSMINAQLAGYLFDVSFQEVKDGVVKNSSVTGSEVIKSMDKNVLILRGPMEVQLPGDVLYTSDNAEILSADVVNATGDHEEEETQELVLPSSDVYRSGGEEHSFSEETTARRVYIIFDDSE